MAYDKKTWVDFETPIEASDMERIDGGLERVYGDLYDDKVAITYDSVSKTVNDIDAPGYSTKYSTSTFSGWYACVGKPQGFNRVRFPVEVREGYPLKSIVVNIYEMPPMSEVTIKTSGVSPRPINWNMLATSTVFFEDSPVAGIQSIITVDFDEVVQNAEGKYLFMLVRCDNRITMGYVNKTYDDIEYNPWIYYDTVGYNNCNVLTGTYDSTSKKVPTLAAEFLYKSSETPYTEIGVGKKDKFFNLVNECINNSDSFGEIFQEAYKTKFICGSQDLSTNTESYDASATSTFTGVVFSIGVIPKEYAFDGCMLKIKGRSYNGSTTPITRVWAYLYAVDKIPTSKIDGTSSYSFSSLNPILLRKGSVTCDIAPEASDIVTVAWEEGEFINTEGKFLMLGYCCNSYNHRCFNKARKQSYDVVGSIDGNTYGTFNSWYNTQKDGGQIWQPYWTDWDANAFSLVKLTKYYDLGEKFYTLLDSALDEALGGVTMNTAPTSEVRLAKQYDLVVGDTFQLFYNGVIKTFNIDNEGVVVKCSKGKEYPRYWEYTPKSGEEGTYTLKLYTRRLDGSVISQGSTKIVVHSQLTNETTPSKLTCLIFGDSLTDGGVWAAEGLRRIYGTATSGASGPAGLGITNELQTYGAKSNTINTFKVSHEGYGGWTWNSFLTAERGSDSTINAIIVTLNAAHGYNLNTVQKSIWTDNNGKLWELEDFPSDTQIKFNRGEGNNDKQSNTANPTSLTCSALGLTITPSNIAWETTNPFYDAATESLDFIAHATKYGAGTPDIVSCLLTWNGGGGALDFNTPSSIATHMDKASQLLTAIHEDCPNAKIIVMGIQISSLTGGTGANYGASIGYADRFGTAFYAFDYNKALEELVTGSQFSEYCYYVDTKGQFDTIYNMPYSEVSVNTRNSSKKEIRGTNGVHPATGGYYQIGDAFYRVLTKVIPIIKAEQDAAAATE